MANEPPLIAAARQKNVAKVKQLLEENGDSYNDTIRRPTWQTILRNTLLATAKTTGLLLFLLMIWLCLGCGTAGPDVASETAKAGDDAGDQPTSEDSVSSSDEGADNGRTTDLTGQIRLDGRPDNASDDARTGDDGVDRLASEGNVASRPAGGSDNSPTTDPTGQIRFDGVYRAKLGSGSVEDILFRHDRSVLVKILNKRELDTYDLAADGLNPDTYGSQFDHFSKYTIGKGKVSFVKELRGLVTDTSGNPVVVRIDYRGAIDKDVLHMDCRSNANPNMPDRDYTFVPIEQNE